MKRIEAYYNLHKRCLSYRPIGGMVRHAEALHLTDVTFSVQPAGRQKVIVEGRKNVHAFVRGTPFFIVRLGDEIAASSLESWFDVAIKENGGRLVTYNPYKYKTFVYADTEAPVFKADDVVILGKKIWHIGGDNNESPAS